MNASKTYKPHLALVHARLLAWSLALAVVLLLPFSVVAAESGRVWNPQQLGSSQIQSAQSQADEAPESVVEADGPQEKESEVIPEETWPNTLVHSEKFDRDQELTGLFASLTQTFYAGDWTIHKATVTLSLSATPLVREDVSDFTVSINGRPFYSERIPLTRGEVYRTTIDIPADAILEGGNELLIESYIRTNETDVCIEDVSKASWLSVLEDSFFNITYSSKAKIESVSDFYRHFTSIEVLENNQGALYIGKNAGDAALTTAGMILTGISSNAVLFYDQIQTRFAENSSALQATKYGIYVSTYDDLPAEIQSGLSTEKQRAAQTGALLSVENLGGSLVLLVTSTDEENLIKAGKLFSYKQYIEQTQTAWREVTSDEKVTFMQAETGIVSRLTDYGAYVSGPFRQSFTFFVNNYSNYRLKEDSRVNLFFRYSENLDFDRSLITVYLNGTHPIGSKKLSRGLANGDSASFALPSTLQIVGNFTLTVAFDLEIKDLECTMRQEDMPWGFVTTDSTVELYSEENNYLVFENYPAPFINQGRLNNIAVVMPQSIGQTDLDVMSETLLMIGRYMRDNSGGIRVCTTDTAGDLSDENVIIIGRYENNAMVEQINEALFFKFSPDGTTLLSNEKLTIEPAYGSVLGTTQLLYSPFSAENSRALLVITGVSDKGMQYASNYIGNANTLWNVYGDGYLADSKNAYYFRFKPDNRKEPTKVERFFSVPGITIAAVAIVVVLLLMVIAVVVLTARSRRKNGFGE